MAHVVRGMDLVLVAYHISALVNQEWTMATVLQYTTIALENSSGFERSDESIDAIGLSSKATRQKRSIHRRVIYTKDFDPRPIVLPPL
jgi:hypothetical protein